MHPLVYLMPLRLPRFPNRDSLLFLRRLQRTGKAGIVARYLNIWNF